jgi:palmitoyltransferase
MSLRSTRTCCFETLKSIPVVFILGIVAWSYYAYVVHMCICMFEFIIEDFNIISFFIVTIDSVPKKGK